MSASLLGHMMEELIAAGVEIHLTPKKSIDSDDGGKMSGAFSEDDKILEVASGRDDCLQVFAHEYCHFKQWQDGLFEDIEVIAAYSCFTPWLLRQRELSEEQLELFIRKMQWLEMENEKRTVKLLKKFKVDFDEEEYITKTNIYMHSYELCKRVRKWHKKALYDLPELMELVSGEEFLKEEDFGELPEGFEAIAMQCYDFTKEEEE